MPKETPRIAVIVVSDYAAPGAKRWDDEEAALRGLMAQDIGEPFDIVLVENSAHRDAFPTDLLDLAPRASVVFADLDRSMTLKDFGVAATDRPLVAVIEADCAPGPAWLRSLVAALDTDPSAGVASGRTTYGGRTALRRVFALLDRSYIDIGRRGRTQHVCANGALYRREVWVAHPYGDEASPFIAQQLRLRSMTDAGIGLAFDPQATMEHAFEGLGFVRDMRANVGFQSSRIRLLAGKPVRPRLRAIISSLIVATRADYRNARRVGEQYLKPFDWPLWAAMMIFVRALEVPGLAKGLDGRRRLAETGYR